MSDNEMYLGYATHKMKWSSYVEYFSKMDMPESQHGYYAVLELNGNEVYRWQLGKLDMMMIFSERPALWANVTEEELRVTRTVNKDALDEFIAHKIGEVFGQVIAFQQHGVIQ